MGEPDQTSSPPEAPGIDQRVAKAAMAVLAEQGWDGFTQERVAERAGISRVTSWRQGLTRERLVAALLDRLGSDFRETLWPVLTMEGTGARRLTIGLERLCDVVDRHAPLLVASDRVFHHRFRREHGASGVDFVEPFARFISEGGADGSLRRLGSDLPEVAEVVFNTVCWTYLHLRDAHDVPAERARTLVINLVLRGLTAP